MFLGLCCVALLVGLKLCLRLRFGCYFGAYCVCLDDVWIDCVWLLISLIVFGCLRVGLLVVGFLWLRLRACVWQVWSALCFYLLDVTLLNLFILCVDWTLSLLGLHGFLLGCLGSSGLGDWVWGFHVLVWIDLVVGCSNGCGLLILFMCCVLYADFW